MRVLKWGLVGVALFVASGAVAAGIVSLAGGHAEAQEPPPIERRGALGNFDEALADELGITVEELEEARQAAFEKVLADAVAAGRLTQEQADKLRQAGPDIKGFGGPRLEIARDAGMGVLKAFRNVVEATAELLDMTVEELREEWTSGKSLADIAEENGIDRDELRAELIDAIQAEIDAAESDGRLTAEQADKLSDALEEHIDRAIDHEGGLKLEGGPGFFKNGGGPRPGPGFMR